MAREVLMGGRIAKRSDVFIGWLAAYSFVRLAALSRLKKKATKIAILPIQ
jgi:hypothetical protein